ncbi:hypothetical protein [Ornithinibacillus contaminans]|uniref:hypothetical protein n=1 Tax=Ornithinibacillus contaminans TaxID=694055 RepID=UPI00064DE141|nr:hypothetical protein [Ornithinibacillus contaminans]
MVKKTTFLVIAIISLFMLTACGILTSSSNNKKNNEYISIVTEGTFYDYPDTYVGDAFNAFFSHPTWDYYQSDENEHIVTFNGGAEYLGEVVNVNLEFEVDPLTEEFEVVWSDFNDFKLSDADYTDLLDTVFSY